MRKLLKKQSFAPDELVTDRLGSYGAARRELRLMCFHEQGLRKNIAQEQSSGEFTSGCAAARAQPAAL